MTDKEEFIKIYNENITRESADKLLDFLENKSDFFTRMNCNAKVIEQNISIVVL